MTAVDSPEATSSAGGAPDARRSRLPAPRPLSPTPTYLGVAVTVIGFVLIAIAWRQVAAETNVALQLPYLVSGGLTGLALVMVGVTVVNVAAKRRDAVLREQQTALLAAALRELSAALDPDGRP
ncbi:MAG TPA: hypothetical protein VNB94_05465 [Mycobacteriales bacterium]|nr:hypothetical protein [Mycobacteriales bacterium]